ncbi:MAG: GHMP kinase [Acidobacteriota bacterium]|nr:GHMP kinase [Acidobacteriota bacterium]
MLKTKAKPPLRIIHARAPIRINDLGGWTDTWFAGRGRVLNAAVEPAVEAQAKVYERTGRGEPRVTILASNYRQTIRVDPADAKPEPHGLLQFAVSALPPDPALRLEITLHSHVPAGISTGTSAAVTVALLGVLNALRPQPLAWTDLAGLAHKIETEKLGCQSGIQDQIAAARGGMSYIVMDEYPKARTTSVRLSANLRAELDRRLCLVYLGAPHRSSAIHEAVIAELERGGPQFAVLRELADLAGEARRALLAEDLDAYGRAMILNHEGQRRLGPGLVSTRADRAVAICRRHGAAGWKVNGAGGAGGSMTVLASPDDGCRRAMIAAVERLGGGVRIIPTRLSPLGVQAWDVL